MRSSERRGVHVHGGLLLVLFVATNLAFPTLDWPWPLLAPLAVYVATVSGVPLLRKSRPQFHLGTYTGWPCFFALALSAFSCAALWAFQVATEPQLDSLRAKLPQQLLCSTLLAGVVFSGLNALLEELVFRGILWEAIADEWNPLVALAATSIFFGYCHLHGYPPGILGAVLAGLFGFALGILRWWTGGIGLTVACHICADATIYFLARNC